MKKFAIIHEFPKTQLLVRSFFDIEDDKEKTSFEAELDDTAMMTIISDFGGGAKEIFEKAQDRQFCIDLLTSFGPKKTIHNMFGI